MGCRGMRSGSCSDDPVACPADWEDVEVWNNPAFLAKRVAEEQELLVLTALLSLEGFSLVDGLLVSEATAEAVPVASEYMGGGGCRLVCTLRRTTMRKAKTTRVVKRPAMIPISR